MAMHPSSNEQVFEATVRELLGVGGVSVVEQEPASLLEAVLHGEGSQESALNLIVHAHVAHLILRVFTPFEKDPWTEELSAMAPRFSQGLQKCHDLLTKLPVPESVPPIYRIGGWHKVVPAEYGLNAWDDSTGYSFFHTEFSLQVLRDSITEAFLQIDEHRLPYEYMVDMKEDAPTTWRLLFVADVVERTVTRNESLTFENWRNLIDLCAAFIDMSEWQRNGISLASEWGEWMGGPPEDTTDIKYIKAPPTSKEFWAWEFGRVAVLYNKFDSLKFDRIDEFQDWPNGVIALSLLLGSGKPVEWTERWTGVIAACDNPDIEKRNPLPVTSGLYWLMHIGVLNVVRRMETQRHSVAAEGAATAPAQQALLLGSPTEIGKAVVEAQEQAEQLRLQKTTDELKQRLSPVWDMLPPDAQEHLVKAELHLKKLQFRDASLDYANSVEAALLEWLPNQKGVSWWPQTLGDLSGLAKRMTAPNPQVDRGLQEIKRWFDVKYATDLRNALEVLQTARLSRAHPGDRLPSAHKARKFALGIDQPSVFELILRFAKRWQG
jgi:hypothetical protein